MSLDVMTFFRELIFSHSLVLPVAHVTLLLFLGTESIDAVKLMFGIHGPYSHLKGNIGRDTVHVYPVPDHDSFSGGTQVFVCPGNLNSLQFVTVINEQR